MATLLPYTGKEFLDSLDDGREVWIYGERIKNIAEHPAFRNTARMVARLYDALHRDHAEQKNVLTCPTEWGGFTHKYFVPPRSAAELTAARDAIAAWSRLTYGWLGRSPDYKAAFLATLGANAEFYAPYQENARHWYRYSQERVAFVNHAIVNPPVDRNMAPGAPGGPTDIYAHATRETDAGIFVTGAKVVATGSALTHFTFVAHVGVLPIQDKNFALAFIIPTNAPGVKFICRVSNEQRAAVLGSPFDYPLSSRLDENDAIFIMDEVFVPWENVFAYADIDKANNFFPRSGFLPRAMLQGCTRLAVKLDFITGLMIKATEIAGTRGYRGVEANIGEVIAWRNAFWGLSDAMAKSPQPWAGEFVLPGSEPASAYQVLAPEAYVQIKHMIEKTVASSLIYLNSHARDFAAPELRKYLDLYVRGSGGVSAVERVKLMKLLWDAVGTEFGARHELYEINYAGSHEEIRRYALLGSLASGQYERWKSFADQCMAEYDLGGWTVPDLVNPDDVSALGDAPVAQLVERARLAEANGYSVVWVADERFYREVYSCLGQLAAHTSKVLLGPCVTDPFARHPALTAMAIATLDEISSGRAILGIDAGISGFAELGIDRRKPARAIREAIELVRALLRGETVDYLSEVVAFNHGRLSFPPIRPEIPIYVASNGPLGQRMAAEIADGVIMEACASAAEVRAFQAAVEGAARKAGRDPRAIRIIARLNTCVAADGRVARDAVRPTVARYLGAGRLRSRTAAAQGLALPAEALAPVAGAAYAAGVTPYLPLLPLITDRHVNAFTLAGTVDEVAQHAIALREAGADGVIARPFAPEGGTIEETIVALGSEVWPRVVG